MPFHYIHIKGFPIVNGNLTAKYAYASRRFYRKNYKKRIEDVSTHKPLKTAYIHPFIYSHANLEFTRKVKIDEESQRNRHSQVENATKKIFRH